MAVDGTEIFHSLQFAAIVRISFCATVSGEQSNPNNDHLYESHPIGTTVPCPYSTNCSNTDDELSERQISMGRCSGSIILTCYS